MPLTDVKARGTVYEKVSFTIYSAVVSIMAARWLAYFTAYFDLEVGHSAAWEDFSKLLL